MSPADRALLKMVVVASAGATVACGGVAVAALMIALGAKTPGGAVALALHPNALPVFLMMSIPLVAPLAAALGPWAALARWRSSGAWVGWQASGASPGRLAAVCLIVALPLGGATGLGMSKLEPLGRGLLASRLASMQASGWLRAWPARAFVPLADHAVVRAEDVVGDGDLKSVTIRWREGDEWGWALASEATLGEGEAHFRLVDARIFWPASPQGDAPMGPPDASVELSIPLPMAPGGTRPPAALTDGALRARIDTMAQAGKPAHGERVALARRRAIPALCPLLALLAVPLGLGRGGTGRRAILGGLGLLLVAGVVRLGEAAGAAGVIGAGVAAWGPVAVVALLCLGAWRFGGLRP